MVTGLFSFTSFFGTVKAYSEISGIIASDTTCASANGPYNLTGNVLIDGGVTVTVEANTVVNLNNNYIRVNGTLIIQPGVTINMATMDSYIQVNGVLSARGTSDNPIRINGAIGYYALIAPPDYSSIIFSASSIGWDEQTKIGSIIEYAILNSTTVSIENSLKLDNNVIDAGISAKNGSPILYKNTIKAGLAISGGSPTITANTFDGGFITFYGEDAGHENVIISNNIISSSKQLTGGISAGIWFGGSWGSGGHVLVEKNLIMQCYNGIEIFSPNFDDLKTTLIIQNNTITNNQVAIYVSNSYVPTVTGNNLEANTVSVKMVSDYSGNSKDINIPNNWWGTTDTAAIDQSIYDFNDDFSLGKVTYMPILTSANPLASPDSSVAIQTPLSSPTTTTSEPTSATTSASQNPTATAESGNQPSLNLNWTAIAIVGLLTLIAVLLTIDIIYRRRRKSTAD